MSAKRENIVDAVLEGREATLDAVSWWIVHVFAVTGPLIYIGTFAGMWGNLSWMLMALCVVQLGPLLLVATPLARLGRPRLGLEVAVGGLMAAAVIGQLQPFDPTGIATVPQAWEHVEFGYLFLSGAFFTLGLRAVGRLMVIQVLGLLTMVGVQMWVAPDEWAIHCMRLGGNAVFLVSSSVGMWFQDRQRKEESTQLREHTARLEALAQATERIAAGDLHSPVPARTDALAALDAMRRQLQSVLGGLGDAARDVSAATQELGATTASQATGAQHQSSMVAETRVTVSQVARDAVEMASAADQMRAQAASVAALSGRLASSIDGLLTATAQIDRVLGGVRDVAFKADVLSINAALEGARAGDEGAGFVHVATRMRLLTADVQASVTQLSELNEQVVLASTDTQAMLQDLVAASTQAAVVTAQIHERSTAQSVALGQTSITLDEIDQVTTAFATSSEQIQASAGALQELVTRLRRAADGFATTEAVPT